MTGNESGNESELSTPEMIENTKRAKFEGSEPSGYRLSESQKDTLQNYKDNVKGYNMQIVELKRNLKAEERRYHKLLEQIGGDGGDGNEMQKRSLIELREKEIRLNHALSQR